MGTIRDTLLEIQSEDVSCFLGWSMERGVEVNNST
jgi:hypothetical protein